MRTRLVQLTTFLALACGLAASAYEFQPMGFQSVAMGGAGVASAAGPFAGYYNPALLALTRRSFELTLGAGMGARDRNLADNLNQLNKDQLRDTLTNIANNAFNPANNITQGNNTKMLNAQQVLANMSGGNNSLAVMPNAMLAVETGTVAIGMYGTSDSNGTAVIDPNHLDLIVATTTGGGTAYEQYDPATNTYSTTTQANYNAHSLQYAINNNLTYVQLNGFGLVEVPISCARKLHTPIGTLGIGASLKAMQGYYFNQQASIDSSANDVVKTSHHNVVNSTRLGVDAGILLQPIGMSNLTIGVVGKDLNSPSFKTPIAGSNYTVQPMYRAGADLAFFNSHLELAADCDLTKNSTLSGAGSQYLGGGVSFRLFNSLMLRAGAMKNLADSTEGTILTAGVGIGVKQLSLNIAAERSVNHSTVAIDGFNVPGYLWLSASLVSRW